MAPGHGPEDKKQGRAKMRQCEVEDFDQPYKPASPPFHHPILYLTPKPGGVRLKFCPHILCLQG